MVHSHGIRGGVVNLAPMTLGSSSMVGGWGTAGLHGRLHAFVKRALLQQLVSPGAFVCELFCGRGTDTANWAQAGIGNYIGIDLSASALEEAKEQWEKLCRPFPATFLELDPCTGNLDTVQDTGLPVDVVTCFAHLQDYFASEDMVRLLLRNIVSLLKPGGYFFGTTPDSSTIWYKYQKAVEEAMKIGSLRVNGTLPRVRSQLYTITFEDDRFQFFGSKYQLRFVDGLPAQMQQLIHFPSFIRLAEEVGLEYVEIQNLTEFYDDYRVPFASTLLSSCKNLLDQKGQPMVDSRGKLSMVATDVLSLYSTFIFKKSTRAVRPPSYLDFHLDIGCQFDRDLEESNLKPDSTPEVKPEVSPGIARGYELTTPRDSSSRTKTRICSLSSAEDNLISSQEDALDTARPNKEESPAVCTAQESAFTTGRNSIGPLQPEQAADTLSEQPADLPSDTDQQLPVQAIEYLPENKSADLEESPGKRARRNPQSREDLEEGPGKSALTNPGSREGLEDSPGKSARTSRPPREDLEVLEEQALDNPEDENEAIKDLADGGSDQCVEITPGDENLPVLPEVDASEQKAKKEKKKKRTARFSRTSAPSAIINPPAACQQTCSVNYQSEVEQEAVEPEAEELDIINISASAPPFLCYQRKKRAETGLPADAAVPEAVSVVAPEAGFGTNTESMRTLRPRRASSFGGLLSAPAVTKGTRSSKASKSKDGGTCSSLITGTVRDVEPGRVRGKASDPAQIVCQELPNVRRSTRSCSSITQDVAEEHSTKPQSQDQTTISTECGRVTRLTRMRSSMRSS